MSLSRRPSELIARETLDAIRLALEASADDRSAVLVIRTLLADSTPPLPHETGSVARLLRAVKRTKRAQWRPTS
jgi:hypothetical protein